MQISDLPTEVFSYLLFTLLDSTSRLNLALCSKKIWMLASRFLTTRYTLETKIDALSIRRLTSITIGHRCHDADLIKHVLKYAINLSEIKFLEREKFTFRFAEIFMTIKRPCTLICPGNAYNAFALAKDESENTMVIISIDSCTRQLDDVKTPDEIKKKMQIYKRLEKQRYLACAGDTFISKSNLSHLISSRVKSLYDMNEYILYSNNHQNDPICSKESAEMAVDFSQCFVESIVVLENYWFFITSLCVFVHCREVDDCADRSSVGCQEKAIAFIRRKTRTGLDFFELTIRFTNVELLATSGFFGHINSDAISAFMGSSISRLPKELKESVTSAVSEYLFIPKEAKQCNRLPRLLNQYIKMQAKNRWMLISKRFEEEGISPIHPLYFNLKNSLQASAASLVLRAFVIGQTSKKEIKTMKKKLAVITKQPKASVELINKYLMKLIEEKEILVVDSSRIGLKKDMLQLYEKVLAGAVRRRNLILVERAIHKLQKERINLFDE